MPVGDQYTSPLPPGAYGRAAERKTLRAVKRMLLARAQGFRDFASRLTLGQAPRSELDPIPDDLRRNADILEAFAQDLPGQLPEGEDLKVNEAGAAVRSTYQAEHVVFRSGGGGAPLARLERVLREAPAVTRYRIGWNRHTPHAPFHAWIEVKREAISAEKFDGQGETPTAALAAALESGRASKFPWGAPEPPSPVPAKPADDRAAAVEERAAAIWKEFARGLAIKRGSMLTGDAMVEHSDKALEVIRRHLHAHDRDRVTGGGASGTPAAFARARDTDAAPLETLLQTLRELAAEVDCRLEHGAEGPDHLRWILARLQEEVRFWQGPEPKVSGEIASAPAGSKCELFACGRPVFHYFRHRRAGAPISRIEARCVPHLDEFARELGIAPCSCGKCEAWRAKNEKDGS